MENIVMNGAIDDIIDNGSNNDRNGLAMNRFRDKSKLLKCTIQPTHSPALSYLDYANRRCGPRARDGFHHRRVAVCMVGSYL